MSPRTSYHAQLIVLRPITWRRKQRGNRHPHSQLEGLNFCNDSSQNFCIPHTRAPWQYVYVICRQRNKRSNVATERFTTTRFTIKFTTSSDIYSMMYTQLLTWQRYNDMNRIYPLIHIARTKRINQFTIARLCLVILQITVNNVNWPWHKSS